VARLDAAAQFQPPRRALARSRRRLVVERRARRMPAAFRRLAALTASAVPAASLAMPLGGRAGFARAAV
jgi:hypothetical protein